MASPEEEAERQRLRQQMQRDMDTATLVSQMKAKTAKGGTFRARFADPSMEPTLKPGDFLEIGHANPVELKKGDIVYMRLGEAFQARKIVRNAMREGEMGFVVAPETNPEETVTLASSQIIGIVVAVDRHGTRIPLQRASLGASLQSGNFTENLLKLLQTGIQKIGEVIEKIMEKIHQRKG